MPNPVKDGATGGRTCNCGAGVLHGFPHVPLGDCPDASLPVAETRAECWTCAYSGEHNEVCMRLDNPNGGICEEPHTRPFSLYAAASIARHRTAGHDVRPAGGKP